MINSIHSSIRSFVKVSSFVSTSNRWCFTSFSYSHLLHPFYSASFATSAITMSKVLKRLDGQEVTVDDIASLYRDQFKTATPLSSYVEHQRDNKFRLKVAFSSRDLDETESNSHIQFYSFSLDEEKKVTQLEESSDLVDKNPTHVLSARSPSGKREVVIRTKKDKDGKTDKYIVDVFSNGRKERSIDLNHLDKHGPVISKFPFSLLQWNKQETTIVYVAEGKRTKTESFFKRKPVEPKKEEKEESEKKDEEDKKKPVAGDDHVLRTDWGEAVDGICHTVISVLEVDTNKITIIDVPSMSLSSPQFANEGESVVFLGTDEEPYHLGIIYCHNRPCSLYSVSLDKIDDPKVIHGGSDNKRNIRCPRVTPDGKTVLFLENSILGPHHKASNVYRVSVDGSDSKCLIDINHKIRDRYVGIYIPDVFPERPFSNDSKSMFFHTTQVDKRILFKMDVSTGDLEEINFPLPSPALLDFDGDVLVAFGTGFETIPSLYLSHYQNLNWVPLTPESDRKDQNVKSIRLDVPSEVDRWPIPAYLLSDPSTASSAGPVIVIPHGGPHSAYVDAYAHTYTLFVKMGFKVLVINYRGSAGLDEQSLNSLCGRCGDLDVKDCISVVNHCLAQGLVDPKKMVLYGGSHGGFLVTHLSAQYPGHEWVSCIASNPVIDVYTMTDATDIPDWCSIEGFGADFNPSKSLTVDQIVAMVNSSPYRHIDGVKTPTLMLLGNKDRRVPMTQGLKWFKGLKARGVPAKCHVYEDKHDLGKVDVNSDVFVNMMVWIFSNNQ